MTTEVRFNKHQTGDPAAEARPSKFFDTTEGATDWVRANVPQLERDFLSLWELGRLLPESETKALLAVE